MSHVLIFGGAGFIGSNLAELLLGQGHKVSVVDNLIATGSPEILAKSTRFFEIDMTDSNEVIKSIEITEPDRIYHLAANSDISASSANPGIDLRNTLETTQSLLRSIEKTGTRAPLIFASSSAVYGEKSGSIQESDVCLPISPYGWMKLASEKLIEHSFANGLLSKVLIARFPNVTGAYQTHGVVYDLVRRAKASSSELSVLGDGSQTKPYVLASELVVALESVILNLSDESSLTLNLSPRDRISVREIANLVRMEVSPELEISFGSAPKGWPGDVNSYELNCERAESLPFMPKFGSSENAIKSAIKWANKNLED